MELQVWRCYCFFAPTECDSSSFLNQRTVALAESHLGFYGIRIAFDHQVMGLQVWALLLFLRIKIDVYNRYQRQKMSLWLLQAW